MNPSSLVFKLKLALNGINYIIIAESERSEKNKFDIELSTFTRFVARIIGLMAVLRIEVFFCYPTYRLTFALNPNIGH